MGRNQQRTSKVQKATLDTRSNASVLGYNKSYKAEDRFSCAAYQILYANAFPAWEIHQRTWEIDQRMREIDQRTRETYQRILKTN